ncbi:MAG: amidase family protein [Alphaproteobacteria bacterium]|jgi:amidase|nr:amidase family protein [Alphaproteobacteria bacterium]
MPLQRPEIEDVIELAKTLGIRLTATEARIFTDRLQKHIESMEKFLELRIEEHRPPLKYLKRDPGYRPTEAEDPLNAFIRKCRVVGADNGPLAGRTVGLKDHTAVAGVPLTLGSHFMDGYIPDFDATIVTRLLDAGATIVGKMNMEDFSFGGPGFAGVGDFGRPLNPHDTDYVTGGSSSGSGAAVAGGHVDIAFGGDQGGSVRIPASWSGCVGLMATHGLIPHTGVFGLEPTIDYVGPMTRTVEDLAAVLKCVAGSDGYDPRQAGLPAKLPDYSGALGQDLEGLTIGVLDQGFGVPGGESDVDRTVREALAVLEGAGVHLETVSVPAHGTAPLAILPLYLEGGRYMYDNNFGGAFAKTFYPASFMATFGRAKHSHSHELPLNLKLMLLSGSYARERYNGRLYAKAQNVRPTIVNQYHDVFREVDLLAMPTVPIKSSPYETPADFAEAIDRTLFDGELAADLGLIITNTAPFNYTGFPALSVPCGKSGGLPVGLQLVGPYFREDLLIRVAHGYQRAVDWESFYP